jgi:excisionase family DNA binding protein
LTDNDTQTLAARLVERIREEMRGPLQAELSRAPQKMQPRLLTAKEAGEYIGRSPQAVRHMIFQQELPVIRQGRNVRLDRKDLDAWIENHRC